MDTVVNTEKTKQNVLKDFLLVVPTLFMFIFIGLKACTIDLFMFVFNYVSYKLDKGYKGAKKIVDPKNGVADIVEKPKKEKVYKYSERRMAQLEKEYALLATELQTSGATRSKEANIYYFKAQEPSGRIITGTMNGYSKLDINTFLVNEGYKVFSIKTSPLINFVFKESSFGIGGTKMSTKELIFWLTQLSTYLKSGITLNDSVKILAKQMSSNKSKMRAFQSMNYELTLGSAFSVAMEKQGSMFPPLLINMIKAAEASGTLTETLEDMANYYTEIDETKKQMKSAMMYPTIISVFAVVVIAFILIWIIPKFVEIYEQNGIQIKGITLFVINLSNFLKNNFVIIFGLLIIGIFTFILCYKNIKAFRQSVQTFLMHVPVIKDLIIYNELAIFTKTFASLLRNNVFITESIDILSKITNNEIYKNILYRTINNIIKGEKISEAFKNHWAVPDVAYFMIVTGESTGELDDMMQKVSEYYQGLHRNQVNSLKSFIEPLMISLLAVVVGVIIISVVVPMFGMYEDVMKV